MRQPQKVLRKKGLNVGLSSPMNIPQYPSGKMRTIHCDPLPQLQVFALNFQEQMFQNLATEVSDHSVEGWFCWSVGRQSACSLRSSLVFDAEEQSLGVVADRDAEKLVPLRAQVVVDDLK